MCPECASALPAPPTNTLPTPAVDNSLIRAAPLPAAASVALSTTSTTETIGPALETPPAADRIRTAVQRALGRLEEYDKIFVDRTGCVSCHNNSLPAIAHEAAQRSGYKTDKDGRRRQTQRVAQYLEGWRENALQVLTMGGQQDPVSYILTGLHAGGYPGDIATDAMVRFLLGVQEADGSFRRVPVKRPPLEGSIFTTTALSVRAILAYAPKPWRADAVKAAQHAAIWLARTEAQDTEDRTFQILGLVWAGQKGPALDRAFRALLVEQRPDGGWAQLSSMQSDAYATGEALFALRESGALQANDPSFLRGFAFLVRTQAEDGSWFVRTRTTFRIQPQFELGFPSYGEDTWISAAATSWATAALALAGKGR
jgi:hypothetical protein